MKTFTLWANILILFTACSGDNETSILNCSKDKAASNLMLRKTGLYPENAENTFDAAGQLQNDIIEIYLAQGNPPGTTATAISNVESIANANAEFQALRPDNYTSPLASRIDYIMNKQAEGLSIIDNSSMSLNAKLSLTGFISTVMSYRDLQKEYDFIYKFIIDYETGIVADNALTSNDKKIILTTTSITRYGFYFASKHRRKPRDRDWDISWGHIIAATDGSEESTASAIVKSTVCGIITNE